jgi:hypothetical protein
LLLLDGQIHHDTHVTPMGNYVIGVGNYMIATPSELGNYMSADSSRHRLTHRASLAFTMLTFPCFPPVLARIWHGPR